jgi:hypothetical protein
MAKRRAAAGRLAHPPARRSARLSARALSRDVLRRQPDAVLDLVVAHLSRRGANSAGLPHRDALALARAAPYLRAAVARVTGTRLDWRSAGGACLCALRAYVRVARHTLRDLTLRGCDCRGSDVYQPYWLMGAMYREDAHADAADVLSAVVSAGTALQTLDVAGLHLCSTEDFSLLQELLVQQSATLNALALPALRAQAMFALDAAGPLPALTRVAFRAASDAMVSQSTLAGSAVLCAIGAAAPALAHLDLSGVSLCMPSDAFALRAVLKSVAPTLRSLSIRLESAQLLPAVAAANLSALTSLTLDGTARNQCQLLADLVPVLRVSVASLRELRLVQCSGVPDALLADATLPGLVSGVTQLELQRGPVLLPGLVADGRLVEFAARFAGLRTLVLRAVPLTPARTAEVVASCRQLADLQIVGLVLDTAGSGGGAAGASLFAGTASAAGAVLTRLLGAREVDGAEDLDADVRDLSAADLHALGTSCPRLAELRVALAPGAQTALPALLARLPDLRTLHLSFGTTGGDCSAALVDALRARASTRLADLTVAGAELSPATWRAALASLGPALRRLRCVLEDSMRLLRADEWMAQVLAHAAASCAGLERLEFDIAYVEVNDVSRTSSRGQRLIHAAAALRRRCTSLDMHEIDRLVDALIL